MRRPALRLVWLIACVIVWLGAILAGSRVRKSRTDPPVEQILTLVPQKFSRALVSMYHHSPQLGTDNQPHPLDPETGVQISDGVYIYNLCKRVRPENTLEIGFAEGFSTVFFLAAVDATGVGFHVAIDPYERSDWHGLGLKKVEELGMQGHFRFLEAKSIFAMPRLGSENRQFQVIFVDGDHKFDAEMTDFVLSDSLCPKGGYLLFHDIWMQSTRKLASFIKRNRPDYKPIDASGTNLLVFQKIADDQRDWRRFDDF